MANKVTKVNKVDKVVNKVTVVNLAKASKPAPNRDKANKVAVPILEVRAASKVAKVNKVAVPVWVARAIRAAVAIANRNAIRPGKKSGRIVPDTYLYTFLKFFSFGH